MLPNRFDATLVTASRVDCSASAEAPRLTTHGASGSKRFGLKARRCAASIDPGVVAIPLAPATSNWQDTATRAAGRARRRPTSTSPLGHPGTRRSPHAPTRSRRSHHERFSHPETPVARPRQAHALPLAPSASQHLTCCRRWMEEIPDRRAASASNLRRLVGLAKLRRHGARDPGPSQFTSECTCPEDSGCHHSL